MCACKHWLAELYNDLLLMDLLARDLGVRSFLLKLTGSNVQQFIEMAQIILPRLSFINRVTGRK